MPNLDNMDAAHSIRLGLAVQGFRWFCEHVPELEYVPAISKSLVNGGEGKEVEGHRCWSLRSFSVGITQVGYICAAGMPGHQLKPA